MKNLKKLIAILSLSAIVLMACGSNDDTKDNVNENTEPQTSVDQNTQNDSTDSNEETSNDIVEDVNVRTVTDNFEITSNHEIMTNYFKGHPDYLNYNFDSVQTFDEYKIYEDALETLSNELADKVSTQLASTPFEPTMVSEDIYHVTEIKISNTKAKPILESIDLRQQTQLVIVDKVIDSYMNENHSEYGFENMTETFNTYEENIMTADHIKDILLTVFENERYSIKLIPSGLSMGGLENDMDQARENLNQYAKYFQTDEITAIFEQHLGQNTP